MSEEASDAEVLLGGDTDVELSDGTQVHVRELPFLEALELLPRVRPMIEAIAETTVEGGAAGNAIEDHPREWAELIMAATGMEREFLERLSFRDGDLLGNACWEANRGFFYRQIMQRLAAKASQPSISSASSSNTDTDETSTS